jgi:hypothetical protein
LRAQRGVARHGDRRDGRGEQRQKRVRRRPARLHADRIGQRRGRRNLAPRAFDFTIRETCPRGLVDRADLLGTRGEVEEPGLLERAPRARNAAHVAVAAAAFARRRVALERAQRLAPLARARPPGRIAEKRAVEERFDRLRQRREREATRRRAQALAVGAGRVEEVAGADVRADRRVAGEVWRQDARERVLADEQQLEHHHREAEEIVLRQPFRRAEIGRLQFRRLVFGDADRAAKEPPVAADLKAVAIDEARLGRCVDDDVVRVDVADDDIAFVHRLERARDVERGVYEKRPVRVGEELLAPARAEEFVQRQLRGEARHEESGRPALGVQHRTRPGGDAPE